MNVISTNMDRQDVQDRNKSPFNSIFMTVILSILYIHVHSIPAVVDEEQTALRMDWRVDARTVMLGTRLVSVEAGTPRKARTGYRHAKVAPVHDTAASGGFPESLRRSF
jgi:hypothetical protein